MTVIGAFMGGGTTAVPAGKCLLHLQLNTVDRQNLSTASWTITATGKAYTATADSSGRADVLVDAGSTYTVTLTHEGDYYNDAAQTAVATSTGVLWVYFDLYKYSEMEAMVWVTTLPGLVVTATSGANIQAETADSDGLAVFRGFAVGSTWTFSANGQSKSIVIQHLLQTVVVGVSVTFSMTFDSTTFATDPLNCLAYGGDCVGFTPVSSPPSSLGACQTLGSWNMNADGTSSNPLLNKCFYATFDSDGYLHQKLNPQNLAQVIAEWDASNSKWTEASGASSITTENTMFVFPALYRKGDASSVTIGDTSDAGVAYGATIGGHTYQYEAIGVYEGYVNGSKLMSLSGKPSSASITRPNFRTYAAANTVHNGKAMLWNMHQWRDWWHLALFAMKSWNSQVAVGQGGFTYNGSVGQGLCDAMGPFAGSTSTTASTSTSVKCFIENPWGYKWEFIDDFINVNGTLYAGQNATPDDTTSNKTSQSGFGTGSGWGSECMTAGGFWGIPNARAGSSTTYQCDYVYSGTSTYLGRVGGHSGNVSNGSAGMSCLLASDSLSVSNTYFGARLAFVFDL